MLVRRRTAPDEADEGFTLIELLVVIIIIGILAAIAIPVFLNQRAKGYDAQAKSDLRNAAAAEETYLADNPGSYGPCDATTGATGCPATLGAPYGWNPSKNTLTAIGIAGANGFCGVSKAFTGDYFVYDSEDGGLQQSPAKTFAGIAWPTGACANSSARPATF